MTKNKADAVVKWLDVQCDEYADNSEQTAQAV